MKLGSLPILMVVPMVASAVIMHFAGIASFRGRLIGIAGAFLCSLLIYILPNCWRTAKIRRVLKGKVIALHLLANEYEKNWTRIHTLVTTMITRYGGDAVSLIDSQVKALREDTRISGNWDLAVCYESTAEGDRIHFTLEGYRLLSIRPKGEPTEVAVTVIDRIVWCLSRTTLREMKPATANA
ncbi:MAG: hypothetical protein ABIJ72_04285 [bacterium]